MKRKFFSPTSALVLKTTIAFFLFLLLVYFILFGMREKYPPLVNIKQHHPKPKLPYIDPSFFTEHTRLHQDSFNSNYFGRNVKMSKCKTCSIEDHEVLEWVFDPVEKVLKLHNKNVWLNCCGKLLVFVKKDEETGYYIFSQTEEGGTGPCGCICSFDIEIEIPRLHESFIQIKVVRAIYPHHLPKVRWEGLLYLFSKGYGSELIEYQSE